MPPPPSPASGEAEWLMKTVGISFELCTMNPTAGSKNFKFSKITGTSIHLKQQCLHSVALLLSMSSRVRPCSLIPTSAIVQEYHLIARKPYKVNVFPPIHPLCLSITLLCTFISFVIAMSLSYIFKKTM